MRILVVHASADGSTAEIAEHIADRLGVLGHDASARPAGAAGPVEGVEAVIVGSAIHGRQWLDAAAAFVDVNRAALRCRPVWIFSVGMPDALPAFVRRMARAEEDGILAQLGDLQPRGHRLFSGVVRPAQFPFMSRVFLRLVGGRYGDFRDWPAIDRWVSEIAGDLAGAAGPAGQAGEAGPAAAGDG